MPIPRASQALSRFTVLDLTRVRAGPTCVRQLADWGANVIRIERPGGSFYFPITTCLLVSVVLSILAHLFSRLR